VTWLVAPVELTIDGAMRAVAAGEAVRFPGEAVVAVALAAPTRAVNVVVRRGAVHAQVRLRPADQPADTADAAATAVIALGPVATDVLLTTPDT
jgi:environmental stress-induced protein Ves